MIIRCLIQLSIQLFQYKKTTIYTTIYTTTWGAPNTQNTSPKPSHTHYKYTQAKRTHSYIISFRNPQKQKVAHAFKEFVWEQLLHISVEEQLHRDCTQNLENLTTTTWRDGNNMKTPHEKKIVQRWCNFW